MSKWSTHSLRYGLFMITTSLVQDDTLDDWYWTVLVQDHMGREIMTGLEEDEGHAIEMAIEFIHSLKRE